MNRHQRRGEPTRQWGLVLWVVLGLPVLAWVVVRVIALVARH